MMFSCSFFFMTLFCKKDIYIYIYRERERERCTSTAMLKKHQTYTVGLECMHRFVIMHNPRVILLNSSILFPNILRLSENRGFLYYDKREFINK